MRFVKWRYKIIDFIIKTIILVFFLSISSFSISLRLVFISEHISWLESIHSENTEKIASIISTSLSLIIGEFILNCTEWYFWLSNYELKENTKLWKNTLKIVSSSAIISLLIWLLMPSISLMTLMYIFIGVLFFVIICLVLIAVSLKYSSSFHNKILRAKSKK